MVLMKRLHTHHNEECIDNSIEDFITETKKNYIRLRRVT